MHDATAAAEPSAAPEPLALVTAPGKPDGRLLLRRLKRLPHGTLGERLHSCMLVCDMTPAALARDSNTSLDTIKRHIRGVVGPPNHTTYTEWAKAFQRNGLPITSDWLLMDGSPFPEAPEDA